jgi:pilus assembly protein CpaF
MVRRLHEVALVSLLADGTRISEIVGLEGDMITKQGDLRVRRAGDRRERQVRGQFRASGVQPQFAERLATAGCRLRPGLFESRVEV